MSWQASLRRRSPVEWGIRAALAIAVAWGGYQAVTHSLAGALPQDRLERAHSLAPGEARVAAALSVQLSGTTEATATDRARAEKLARTALLRDPTAVDAVVSLGIGALFQGDQAMARRVFAYSQRLSRRDLRTQLWAIEDAVGRGDVPSVLRHYDIALRTKAGAQDILFPILASAIEEPDIRAGLVRTLAGKPLWGSDFIEYVAGNSPVPRATARLLNGLERAGVPVPSTAAASIISALINHGDANMAWAYYAGRHRGADRRQSRDADFTGEIDNPSAFDWSTISDMGLTASIQRGDTGGIFDFGAPAGVGGIVLQQMQVLPPGEYALVGHSIGLEQPKEALPYWTLSCRAGTELGRVAMPNSTQMGGQFAGRFVVPEGCPVQVLSLVVQPTDAIAGVTGRVDRVFLRPVR